MNILFDYDGTIHNTVNIYAESFRATYNHLVDLGFAEEKHLSDRHIASYLGLTPVDAWKSELPNISDDIISICVQRTGDYMNKLIREKKSNLYDGAEEVISKLKQQGHRLLILSNCTLSYKLAHLSAFNLENWFDYFYAAEEFNYIPKHAIFDHIKRDYPGKYIVIGDRKSDIDISSKEICAAIGCTYGSGDLEELKIADHLAHNINEIPILVEKIIIQS